MKSKSKVALIVLIFIFFIAIIGSIKMKGSNNHYPNTPLSSLGTMMDTLNTTNEVYIIVHKDGCSDCKKVESFTSKRIDQLKKEHKPVIVLESTSYKKYIKIHNEDNILEKYDVQKVPTFLRINHGNIVDQYTGTNEKLIKEILETKKNEN